MKTQTSLFTTIITTLLIGTGCVKHDLDDYEVFDESVSKLSVNVESADLLIKPSNGDKSVVDMDMTYRGGTPDYTIKVTDERLKVTMKCPFTCDGDIIIRVPKTVLANLDLDSGNIKISDMEGDIDVNIDSGNLKVDNLSGDLDLQTDSGNISGTVSSMVCYADTDSGNVSLKFEEIPEQVDIATDSGNVKIKVPEGEYDISTHIDSGSKNLDNVEDDSASDSKISIDVDSGNVDIIGI